MGNPIPTKIKFNDFIKTIEIISQKKFSKYNIINQSGSARRIELFRNKEDNIPTNFWVVHEDKCVWSGDFKKACLNLGVDKKEFEKIAKSI